MVITTLLFTAVPLWAAEETNEAPDWVISYTIMLLFLALTLLILLRPTKRSDSAFSDDEQRDQKEEALKKMQGGH